MKFLIVPALFLSSIVMAQTSDTITVKPSPASDALNRAAQESVTQQKSFDAILSQARVAADTSQKSLQTEIQKANADLLAELKADKKYKDKLAAIDVLQKGLQTAGQKAEQKFVQDAGPLQNEIGKDKLLIEGLIPVVRKENDFPPTANFDTATQKWTLPKASDKPVEPKKP